MAKDIHHVDDDGKSFVFIERTDLEKVLATVGLTDEQSRLILKTVTEYHLKYDAQRTLYVPTSTGNS